MVLEEFNEKCAAALGLQKPKRLHQTRGSDSLTTSLLFLGKYQGEQAVLKVLPPSGRNEIYNMSMAGERLQSEFIAVPNIRAFGAQDSFGEFPYIIYEYIEGVGLFPHVNVRDPLTSHHGKTDALRFYFRYREDWGNMCPFIPKSERGGPFESVLYTRDRILGWYDKAIQMNPLLLDESVSHQCMGILPWLLESFKDVPLEFQHGHFSNEHLVRANDKFYLLDFAHCGWRPRLYDLAYMVSSLISLHSFRFRIPPKSWTEEIERWEMAMRSQGLSQEDVQLFRVHMAERALHAILVELGQDKERSPEERRWMSPLWSEVLKHCIFGMR